MKNKQWKYKVMSILSIVIFIGVWSLCTDVLELASPIMLPGPWKVLHSLIDKFTNANPDGATLIQHIVASLKVALLGFTLGVVIGVPLGISMAWFERFDKFIKPVFDLIRPIPPVAWIPLMIMWLGIGITSKAVIIFFSAFIPCVINSYAGIKQTKPVNIWVAKTFGASNGKILWKVAIPTALPSVFTGIRLSLQLAWTSLVAAEMLASTAGLGFMIQMGRMLARPDIILVGMVMIGAFGAFLSKILEFIEKKMVKEWQ